MPANIIRLSNEKLDLLAQASRNKLINFCEFVDPKYDTQWFHEKIAEKLQEAFERVRGGGKARIVLELPPRHGKSELATIKFPAWVLGACPEYPVVVASYSQNLAEDFGLKTRDLMQDDYYKKIFNTRLREDSTAKGKWLTSSGGGYTATGVGGSITGRGYKIGIIDDPIKNREEAESSVYRDKIWSWYASTFYTRQEGYGAIVVICTRWHFDDLVGRIEAQEREATRLREKNYDEWEYLTFPAIAEEDDGFRKKGGALWPGKFPLRNLETIKNSIGTYDFSSLYQQMPIPSGHQEFDKKSFRIYRSSDLRDKRLEYYTSADPAIGTSEHADNWVVTTVAKERSGPNIYRIEESVGKGNPADFIAAYFSHYEKYRSFMSLETVAYQKSLVYAIREEQKKRQEYFFIYELKNNKKKSKQIRIRGLIPLYQASVIYHLQDDDAYEKELLDFPFGAHDDRIDTMANFLEVLEERGGTQYDDPEPRQREIIFDPFHQRKELFP